MRKYEFHIHVPATKLHYIAPQRDKPQSAARKKKFKPDLDLNQLVLQKVLVSPLVVSGSELEEVCEDGRI